MSVNFWNIFSIQTDIISKQIMLIDSKVLASDYLNCIIMRHSMRALLCRKVLALTLSFMICECIVVTQ